MASTFWARTDSGSANNPALNLTGAAAVQISFVKSGSSGDLILEGSSSAADPDTQVSIGGQVYDFNFVLSGTLPSRKSDGSQQVPDQFEGSEIYIVTILDYPAAGQTTRLAFMPNELATQAEMQSFGKGAIDVQHVDSTTPGAVCFAGGTRILTPQGNILVEHLKVGDLVTTLDHGPQPILWIAQSELTWPDSSEKERPVQISAGALGLDMPQNNLVLSPQHKVLLGSGTTGSCPAANQVLAPAKGLTSLPGVRVMKGKRRVVYFHILLQQHEILISEGIPSESFFPGATAMKMLRPHQIIEILALVPALARDRNSGYGPPARDCLTHGQTKALLLNRAVDNAGLCALGDEPAPRLAA